MCYCRLGCGEREKNRGGDRVIISSVSINKKQMIQGRDIQLCVKGNVLLVKK